MSEALNLQSQELICFVGGGGKSSAIHTLSQELKAEGKKVLVTTTTQMARREAFLFDRLMLSGDVKDCFPESCAGTAVCFGDRIDDQKGKLFGVSPEAVDTIFSEKKFEFILVEADGAKRKPVKAPADYEPVVPRKTTKTVGVIGLDALGKPLIDKYVHRPHLFCSVTGGYIGKKIGRNLLVSLILSERGLFKGVCRSSFRYVLLNKAENALRRIAAKRIAETVMKKGSVSDISGVIISCLSSGRIYSS